MNFKHSLVFALLLTGGASFSEAATTNVSASAPDVLKGPTPAVRYAKMGIASAKDPRWHGGPSLPHRKGAYMTGPDAKNSRAAFAGAISERRNSRFRPSGRLGSGAPFGDTERFFVGFGAPDRNGKEWI